MKLLKSHKSFGGQTDFWEHDSLVTGTKMRFSTVRSGNLKPKQALIFLSGLTCSEENFVTKSGVQALLQDSGNMVICPDTSPRGLELPSEHDAYDFGSGAGFYLNALTAGYKDHYRMYDYVNEEIYQLLVTEFHIPSDSISISGHSMGGHGALVLGLRNPQKYKSVSAFSPIVHPTRCAWGKKAFDGYLGAEAETAGKNYDATELLGAGHSHPKEILIDQGLADEFLAEQLLAPDFEAAAKESQQALNFRFHEDYDHSYYFISSFLGDHLKHHFGH